MKEDNPTYKPASSIAPSIVPRTVYSIEDTEQFWKEANTELHRCFQKGSMIGKGNSVVDTDYIKVIDIVVTSIFQSIRDSVNDENLEIEERQDKLHQVKVAETSFKSAIEVLAMLEIKLDSNSVICILQGCINESALQLSKKYERRLRT